MKKIFIGFLLDGKFSGLVIYILFLIYQIKNDYGLYEFENYEPNIEWGDDD